MAEVTYSETVDHDFPIEWWDWETVAGIWDWISRKAEPKPRREPFVLLDFDGGQVTGPDLDDVLEKVPTRGRNSPKRIDVICYVQHEGKVHLSVERRRYSSEDGSVHLRVGFSAQDHEYVLGLAEGFRRTLAAGDFPVLAAAAVKRKADAAAARDNRSGNEVNKPRRGPWWPDLANVRDNLVSNLIWYAVAAIVVGSLAFFGLR